MDIPYFIISIDLELLWGRKKTELFNLIKRNEKELREKIDNLLQLFEKFDIPATWAIVGHLFLEQCDKKTCLTSTNIKKYKYGREWYIDPYTDLSHDPLFYGKDLIEKIISSSAKHEIGYHSFSHPNFSEISAGMAENEIKEAKKIEKEWNIKLKSFVFPYNKIAHVNILKENGFMIYRGKSGTCCANEKNIVLKKFKGSVDKIIAPPVEPKWIDGIWEIQSSAHFCDPQTPKSLFFKSKLGLERAISNKKIFHIWFHCWSPLLYKKLEQDLRKFLECISEKRREDKLEVITMGELAEKLNLLKRRDLFV